MGLDTIIYSTTILLLFLIAPFAILGSALTANLFGDYLLSLLIFGVIILDIMVLMIIMTGGVTQK